MISASIVCTDNQSLHTIDGSVSTDKIDAALGLLQDEKSVPSTRLNETLIFFGPANASDKILAAVTDAAASADIAATRLKRGADPADVPENAAIIVADISGGNPEVCWRAGFAQGRGACVIYLCRRGQEPETAIANDEILTFEDCDDLTRKFSARLKLNKLPHRSG